MRSYSNNYFSGNTQTTVVQMIYTLEQKRTASVYWHCLAANVLLWF